MTESTAETLLWRGTPSQWTNFGAYRIRPHIERMRPRRGVRDLEVDMP